MALDSSTVKTELTQVQRIWRGYGRLGTSVRLRVLGRYLLCPYMALLPCFPSSGRILDVGCGDGILGLLLGQQPGALERSYVGIDHAEDKVQMANSACIYNAKFLKQDISEIPSGSFDCVSVVDVLYCIPLARWPQFLSHCTRVLKGGGIMVVKETGDRPRWKRWLTYVEETLAIKVLKITKGDSPHFEPEATYRRHIEAAGAKVYRLERLDRWRPHPHLLVLARKV